MSNQDDYTDDWAELPPTAIQNLHFAEWGLTVEERAKVRWRHHPTEWYADIPSEIAEQGEDIWTVEVGNTSYALCSYWSGSDLRWHYQRLESE